MVSAQWVKRQIRLEFKDRVAVIVSLSHHTVDQSAASRIIHVDVQLREDIQSIILFLCHHLISKIRCLIPRTEFFQATFILPKGLR
jgi:hypothetical protein